MSLFPHPFFSAALAVLWLILAGFSPGQLTLAIIVGLGAGFAYEALTPEPMRLRRPGVIARLVAHVAVDIVHSNVLVASLIITNGRHGTRRSGFVRIPLELTDKAGLAVLSMIITATPSTLWIDYEPEGGILLLHAFDLIDEQVMIDHIKERYEAPLKEIFG